MTFLPRFLRGGRDELGFDDLVARAVDAAYEHGHRGERGRMTFPSAVTIRFEAKDASVEVVRRFVHAPEFDGKVAAALANRADTAVSDLPEREYVVAVGASTRVAATAVTPRPHVLRIRGGDRDGVSTTVASVTRELRFGRGSIHGVDRGVPNDLVLCESAEFVSRRAGRIFVIGSRLEVESLDQGDTLVVRRASGEAIRPARTAKGRVALTAGDAIELPDGRGNAIAILIARGEREESS